MLVLQDLYSSVDHQNEMMNSGQCHNRGPLFFFGYILDSFKPQADFKSLVHRNKKMFQKQN